LGWERISGYCREALEAGVPEKAVWVSPTGNARETVRPLETAFAVLALTP
jgi:hypothetical protein